MKDKRELTEEEKYELELQTEQELGRLTRTYTVLDRNRTQFGDKISKTERVLNIYKKEQNNILTDLVVASADARKKEDERKCQQITDLLKEYKDYNEDIKMQKMHLKEINGQIQIVKRKVLGITRKTTTDLQYLEKAIKSEKTLQTLENKLEVQIKKFCAINAENYKLRLEIHHLLIERREFNKIWDKLIHNLSIGKKFMLDLIEQATIAYDQREEWVTKLQALRNRAHHDLVAHIHEMNHLQRKKDNDIKLQEFFIIKGQKKIMRDLEKKEKKKRMENRANMEKKLERYLEMLCSIMEFTGEEKIQNIARDFLEQEERNFAMFKYINHLNYEMEHLSDELGRLHFEIDKQNMLHSSRREQQGNRISDLREEYNYNLQEVTSKTAELNAVDNKLNIIMKGVNDLFRMFKCHNDPLLQLLGTNDTINNHSVLLYLEILEKNIQDYLISIYYYEKHLVEQKKMKSDHMLISESVPPTIEAIDDIVTSSPCPLCVEHDNVADVIDELQYALTKKEIQEKLATVKELPEKVHNVSACHLPKSRQIIQKRYQ